VQAGAGIVADSDPAAEYQETVNKASALLVAVARERRFQVPGAREERSSLAPGTWPLEPDFKEPYSDQETSIQRHPTHR
jgi:hypothetical protein